MRAYVLKHYGGPEGSLLMDVSAPTPRPRDILVEVRAAGLNPVDFKFRQGKLRAILRPKLPFVLGNEFAGEVIGVGDDVKQFRVGEGTGIEEACRLCGSGRLQPWRERARREEAIRSSCQSQVSAGHGHEIADVV